jgi:hypothetical protein
VADYFARIPDDAEQVVAIVRREAGEECPDGHPIAGMLDECVRDSVLGLWDSRIKTFVPLLALRRVRACARAGSCAAWVS